MKNFDIFLCLALALSPVLAVAQSVVYPLDIGTKWRWSQEFGNGYHDVEITRDTVVPNGHRYSIIPAYVSIPERWERLEDTRIYRYNPAAEREWLEFDFSKSPGDTINTSAYLVMLSATVDTLWGIRRRTWEFGFLPPGIPDGASGYVITDSMGLTNYGDYSSTLRVLGATVGTRTYGTISGVASPTSAPPTSVLLSQNYPNPFNPVTTIRYALPQRSHVTLTVFNTLGQQVATLVDGTEEAGYHTVRFDGSTLASGVYFYQLRAGEYVECRRLMLLK